MALPQYTLAFWLSTLSAKSYRVNQHNDETDKHGVDLKVSAKYVCVRIMMTLRLNRIFCPWKLMN